MSKGKLVAVCFVWLFLLGIGVLAWKLILVPAFERDAARAKLAAEEQQQHERAQKVQQAGTPSRYQHQIDFHLDSFSGYAIIRSDQFSRDLSRQGVRLQLHDDGADYMARLKALQSGEADMAVFTIDALVKVSAELDDLPATIVALLDETTGADAIVAYKSAVPNVDALNTADTRFVLTMNSPSETLARVVMSRFELDQLGANPFVEANDAADVVQQYKRAKPNDPLAYVLWEPYVSQVLTNPEMHVVVDSSRFPSSIVDVIVASRDFVLKNHDVVKTVVESYLRTQYSYRQRDAMVKLVMADAEATGAPLTDEQANTLVDGIWWKNTQENLAHLGLLSTRPLPHLEDMIANITDVLESTGGIAKDPTDGNPNYLFYAQVLDELRDFHPGVEEEEVRDVRLAALSDEQWGQLTEVGTARVPNLVFARGTDRLTSRSQSVMDELAVKLATTRFYVLIRGNASRRGDAEKNRQLAERRAQAAQQYLIDRGVDGNRIRAVGGEPSGTTSVTFMLGQLPY